MVLNAKKFNYMWFGIGSETDDFIFDGIKSPNSCDEYIRSMRKKAAWNLGMLHRISSLLGPEKKKVKFNALIKAHFSYYLSIWVFGSGRSNNLIN